MDYTDPQVLQALAVAAVAVLVPLAVAIIRRWRPDFSVSDAWRKAAVAYVIAFASAFFATPGNWREKLFAGAVAVVLSQGVYSVALVARSPNGGE